MVATVFESSWPRLDAISHQVSRAGSFVAGTQRRPVVSKGYVWAAAKRTAENNRQWFANSSPGVIVRNLRKAGSFCRDPDNAVFPRRPLGLDTGHPARRIVFHTSILRFGWKVVKAKRKCPLGLCAPEGNAGARMRRTAWMAGIPNSKERDYLRSPDGRVTDR